MKANRLSGLLLVLILIATVSRLSVRAAEPSYNGKPLSEWLLALHADLSDEEVVAATQQNVDPAKLLEQKQSRAQEAIRQIGTNGLPALLDLVSVVERNRRSVAKRIKSQDMREGLRGSNPEFREAVRGMAVDGFGILGTNAEPAIPQLTKLLHGDPDCQLDVTRALIRVGPKGFAVLTNILNDPRDGTRNTLIWVIGEEGGNDRAVTELLIQALKDPDWSNRGNAAKFLKGKDASLVVPALIPLLDAY
jgi:HEAT repeat protein